MQATYPPLLRRKVRRLKVVCGLLWLAATLAPVFVARSKLTVGPWPVDFWWAAQGGVLVYLLIVVVYAWLINRWERQARGQSADEPPLQED